MEKSLQLSVSIIAKNEEIGLRRALESLDGIAEEIIVVHNDCTDRTVQVALEFGAKCYEKKWSGFIDQKNFALSKCTQKWILCIDADEALSEELRRSIQEFIVGNDAGSKVSGVCFNRCSFFLGKWIKHGDWYPDRKLGLVQKGTACWVGINPHAKLELINSTSKVLLKGDLEHYSFIGIKNLTEKSIAYADVFISQEKTNSTRKNALGIAVLRATWRFIRCYFLRLGFMDGSVGFIIAFSIAHETLLKHGGKWELLNVKQ